MKGPQGTSAGGTNAGWQPVDLTQPVYSGMPLYPSDPPVGIVPLLEHERNGMALAVFHLGTHSGTHIDAPYHLYLHGRKIGGYLPDRFVSSSLVLDIRPHEASKDRAPLEVGPESVAAAADAAGGLRPGDLALLLTGWDAHYDTSLMTAHPYLSPDAAQLLLTASVSLVGTDAPSLDSSADGATASPDVDGGARKEPQAPSFDSSTAAPTGAAGRCLRGRKSLPVVGVPPRPPASPRRRHPHGGESAGTGRVGCRRVTCVILPLHIRDGDGAPARAIPWNEGPQ